MPDGSGVDRPDRGGARLSSTSYRSRRPIPGLWEQVDNDWDRRVTRG